MPRPARRYNRRIQVWSYIANDDGYGGNTTSDTLLSDVWAEVRTLDRDKMTSFGLDVNRNGINVFMRKDPNVDMDNSNLFLLIGGREYTITSVIETDLDGVEVEIIATG